MVGIKYVSPAPAIKQRVSQNVIKLYSIIVFHSDKIFGKYYI